MERANYITALLLMAGCWVTELHHVARHLLPYYQEVHWFIIQPRYAPDSLWYIKCLSVCLRHLLWAIAAYRIAAKCVDRIGRKLVSVIFITAVYTVFDLFLFFLNFQIRGYDLLIILTALASWIALIKPPKRC